MLSSKPVLTLLTSLFILAACGSGNNDSGGSSSTSAAAETVSETDTSTMAGTESPVSDEAAPDVALPAGYEVADLKKGRRVFAKCRSCHVLNGSIHGVGPNLDGVFTRGIGEAEGFRFSKAAQAAEFKWTPEKLDEWLQAPRTFLPGTTMSFAGLKKEEDRINLIAYIYVETGGDGNE